MTGSSQAERTFGGIAARFEALPAVTRGTGFGSSPGLRVKGKIFAMLSHGELVVKLPKDRVDELVASGTGERFDAGKGRPMNEWLAVPPRKRTQWERIVAEAFEFAGGGA